ncbi:MAG: hypothetical protein PHC86_09360 [Eubacteriales bacterium]|nr:hypothetical protein [Eubacteriales bacterium]
MDSETRVSQTTATRRKSTPQKMPFAVYLLASLFIFFTRSGVGRVIGILIVVAMLLAVEMLIFRSNATLFFQIVGAELLVANLGTWIYFLLQK